jgi:hypothetical protein
MQFTEFKEDFKLQLSQVTQKIQELNVELLQLQQQALKLQGAVEAVDLIEQNFVPLSVAVTDFEESAIIDVESIPVKRTTKK